MIDFSGYTKSAIEKDMLAQVPKEIDTREGSMIQTAVGPAAWYLEGLYMLLSQVQQNAYANTAVSESLDFICAERGVKRKAATAAVRRGTFNVEIPEGAVFKTMGGANSVSFMSGRLLARTDTAYTYELTCSVAGTAGNAYTGNLLPVTAINGLTSASIGEIILSGNEEESDDSLRARYFATFDISAFGGNMISYRMEILAIPGVGAVQIYPAWKGGGTVLCSILSSSLKPADAALVEQVQAYICPLEEGQTSPSPGGYGMAPIGAAVTITTGSILNIDVSCTIQLVDGAAGGSEAYQTLIEEKIEEYLATVRQTWGNPIKGQKIEYMVSLYISRIAVAILSIEEIVNVTDITMNGSAEDLKLTETPELQEIPLLGTVTVHGS
ncbi:MAG: baseplate J/gp47 family protein [Lachnospiraceae bacterium]|nr:baseplate J/gp47 family protein [Lachnospiraceae bacterium]